ncbi:MAG: hypothetical protein J6Y32_02575 [Bacteroidales bacterium]|nr:hypothetical protein [Bacteroidales bacterium]
MSRQIKRCEPQRIPDGLLFRDLSFIYVPDGYSWWDRFFLNRQHSCLLKKARRKGIALFAENERVAFDLHRYYRVDPEAIRLLKNE